MAEVMIKVLEIVDDSGYPTIIKCELTDYKNIKHYFIDKVPVICGNCNRYEMHLAVGTSVFIMAFTALIGGVSHFAIGGLPDIECLILCVVFTFIWARIAAVIANKASAKTLNRVVGIVMIVTSVVILTVNYLL